MTDNNDIKEAVGINTSVCGKTEIARIGLNE